jgi:hypothetical protein
MPGLRQASLQKHYLLGSDGVVGLEWVADRSFLLIAREACLYASVDLTAVPESARRRYLELQVRKRSPWDETGHFLSMTAKDKAMLWLWDGRWETSMREQLPSALAQVAALPEAVMLPRGKTETCLRACSRGYEFQAWDDGQLDIARWFAEKPVARELENCLRSAGRTALDTESDSLQWLSSPWSESVFDWRELMRNELGLFTIAASVMLFALFLELGMVAVTGIEISLARSRNQALQEELGDQLQFRLLAERLRTVNEQWGTVMTPYSQLEIVSEFTSRLDNNDYELVDWEYRGDSLRVVLKQAELDSRDTVLRLAASELFADVRIEPGLREGESAISIVLAAGPNLL